MAGELKLRRGTTQQHEVFTGAQAEVTVDTDTNTLVVHDGVTPGGFRVPNVEGMLQELGTMAQQDADNVAITGGAISGITDLAVADGGTGASTAANARANLSAAGRISPATPGNLVQQTADGDLEDAGIAFSDFYEEITKPLDGDFTAGEISIVRMGNVVTVSMSSVSFLSASVASTTTDFLPSHLRPIEDVTCVFGMDFGGLHMATIRSGGEFSIASRDFSGMEADLIGSYGFSTSYITNYGWPSV